MNILYICPRFPYPPAQGDKVVIYNHLKFLSKRNSITLLTLISDEEELRGLPGLAGCCSNVETFKRRPNFSLRNFITAIFKTDPFTVIRYYSPEMFKRSKELIESGRFDIIHVSQYYMSQYAISKKISIPVKTAVILDTHHIQYLIYSKFARMVKNPVVKLLTILEALRIKGYELPVYKKFDKCLAVNELDKKTIERLSGAPNVVVNPFCMELSLSPVSGAFSEEEEENTIIFFGTLKTLPNTDGLKFFYKQIFPFIKKEIPGVKFIIAGDDPYGLCAHLARDPNVRVVGVISGMRDFLKRVAVVVVPLRVIGGGLTMKILEAWAAGKAVVSTLSAAEGIAITNGADIIIADSPADFAKEVVALLKDKEKRKAIGRTALKKINEYYSPERVIAGLEDIYKETVRSKTGK